MRAKRQILLTILAGTLAAAAPHVHAQGIMYPVDVPPRVKKHKPQPDVLPAIPTLAPALTIPVASMGYGAPSPTYLGRRYSLIALDFLDEDQLLFSFRAPGLLAREATDSAANRQMKAVVLKLPAGTVEAQTVWTVPDRAPYLWMLGNGRFLLRDRGGFEAGDSSLKTEPLFQLPGQFVSLQVDRAQKVIVASSIESPSTDVTVRVIDPESGKVRPTSHARTAPELPINGEGFLETSHDKYDQWSLKLNGFDGTQKVLGHIASNCLPSTSFIEDQKILVTGCFPTHVPKLAAVSMTGQVLWESEIPVTYVPPLLLTAAKGSRFVRESIVLKKAPTAGSEMLWVKNVRGQVARVYDTGTGKISAEVPIDPILDAGGNVAISPSGRRLAVLNGGSIQVYDLPAN